LTMHSIEQSYESHRRLAVNLTRQVEMGGGIYIGNPIGNVGILLSEKTKKQGVPELEAMLMEISKLKNPVDLKERTPLITEHGLSVLAKMREMVGQEDRRAKLAVWQVGIRIATALNKDGHHLSVLTYLARKFKSSMIQLRYELKNSGKIPDWVTGERLQEEIAVIPFTCEKSEEKRDEQSEVEGGRLGKSEERKKYEEQLIKLFQDIAKTGADAKSPGLKRAVYLKIREMLTGDKKTTMANVKVWQTGLDIATDFASGFEKMNGGKQHDLLQFFIRSFDNRMRTTWGQCKRPVKVQEYPKQPKSQWKTVKIETLRAEIGQCEKCGLAQSAADSKNCAQCQ